MLTLMVMLYSWSLVSCGDDDDDGIVQNNPVNNGGGNNNGNNGGSNIDAPQELFGAWQMSDEQDPGHYFIYVFNADGTGKMYSGCNPADNTARSVNSFVYSFNRQNAAITFDGMTYTIEFKNNNTKLNLSIYGHVVMELYTYDGELPNMEHAPSVPTGITATVDGTSISVSWQSVNEAKSYNVYRSNSAEGEYSLIGTSTSTSYKDNSPISGYNYYKVSAVNGNGTSSLSDYASCNHTSSGNAPSSPTGLQAQVNGTSVTITWQSVNNATSYIIYRSSNASSSYTQIGTSNSTSYTDNNPISGYNYYKISAVNSYGESPQSSYASCNYDGGGSSTPPSAPSGVTATNQGSQNLPRIFISWSPVSNATSYKVFRSSSASGSYSQIGSSTLNDYYDNSPLSGNNYYRVKAVNSAGESPYSSFVFCYNDVEYEPCPPKVTVSGTTSQKVSWEPPTSSGCGTPTSYKVYKRNPFTGEWELKTTTTSKSYSPPSSDIHPGENWYGVTAINNSGSSAGLWAHSEGGATLAKPTNFNAQKLDSEHVYFTWSKVAWATGYSIFSSFDASGSYSPGYYTGAQTGNQTSCTVYCSLKSGTTIYFKIKAIFDCTYAGGVWSSDFTTYRSVTF